VIPHQIGVIAIGRNEGKRLIDCLTSVRSATADIVYVDSGSTDGSVAAAEAIGACVVKLDLTRPFTAARARNEGFEALKALRPSVRFIQFIDGDCTLAQPWIERALALCKCERTSQSYAGVEGSAILLHQSTTGCSTMSGTRPLEKPRLAVVMHWFG